MSELVETLRDAVEALGAKDRTWRRFGAKAHRYQLLEPVGEAGVAAIERELGTALPDAYRDFVRAIAAGGAGPAYGLIDAPAAARAALRQQSGPWHLAIPLAHFGCGYAVVLALDGIARGQVWLHARAIDFVATIAPTFTSWYVDWVDKLARDVLPDGYIPANRCALPAALTGFFGVWERRLGIPAGSLDGAALRDALGQLGPGSIEIAADSAQPLFESGDRVDPCVTCARLVASLTDQGLAPDVIAPGMLPLPLRE